MYQPKTRSEDRLSFEKDRRQSEDSVFLLRPPTLSLPAWIHTRERACEHAACSLNAHSRMHVHAHALMHLPEPE